MGIFSIAIVIAKTALALVSSEGLYVIIAVEAATAVVGTCLFLQSASEYLRHRRIIRHATKLRHSATVAQRALEQTEQSVEGLRKVNEAADKCLQDLLNEFRALGEDHPDRKESLSKQIGQVQGFISANNVRIHLALEKIKHGRIEIDRALSVSQEMMAPPTQRGPGRP